MNVATKTRNPDAIRYTDQGTRAVVRDTFQLHDLSTNVFSASIERDGKVVRNFVRQNYTHPQDYDMRGGFIEITPDNRAIVEEGAIIRPTAVILGGVTVPAGTVVGEGERWSPKGRMRYSRDVLNGLIRVSDALKGIE